VNHRVDIDIDGARVATLDDILPARGPMRMLLVGTSPSPKSVSLGHYLQAKPGRAVWKHLIEAQLLQARPQEYADDLLVSHGYGMTMLSRLPRQAGDEPEPAEYEAGWERVARLVAQYRPKILTFVRRGALDKVLLYSFGWEHHSDYGFNDDLMRTFGRRVFAFPLPGGACTVREARRHMSDLAGALSIV
jgi:G:T/U-mismatch repair DNA glycosylase